MFKSFRGGKKIVPCILWNPNVNYIFIAALHLTVSWARRIKSMSSVPVSFRYMSGTSMYSLICKFPPTKPSMHSPLFHTCNILNLSPLDLITLTCNEKMQNRYQNMSIIYNNLLNCPSNIQLKERLFYS